MKDTVILELLGFMGVAILLVGCQYSGSPGTGYTNSTSEIVYKEVTLRQVFPELNSLCRRELQPTDEYHCRKLEQTLFCAANTYQQYYDRHLIRFCKDIDRFAADDHIINLMEKQYKPHYILKMQRRFGQLAKKLWQESYS